ncbi:MAG: molybdopterin dinucleotide binding domain-containing protein, partial [Syntrophobacteraceae bacterium]
QEGRAQFAHPVHCGGEPIRSGEHPPRVYSGLVPGGDHLPAWKALASIAGMEPMSAETADIAPEKFIPPLIPGFDALGYPVDGKRLALAKAGFKTQWGLRASDIPRSPLIFELLMVEWMFGTSEFSAWSDSLAPAVLPPLMSISAKDAVRLGLVDNDKVSVELVGGAFEIVVSVSERTAEGVLIVPRHNALEWQKNHDFPVFVSSEKIHKI